MARDKQGKEKPAETGEGGGGGERVTGLEPATLPDPVAPVSSTNLGRVGDYGDMGQFAPGGYYNQRGVTAPRRIDLDEYTKTSVTDDDEEE